MGWMGGSALKQVMSAVAWKPSILLLPEMTPFPQVPTERNVSLEPRPGVGWMGVGELTPPILGNFLEFCIK